MTSMLVAHKDNTTRTTLIEQAKNKFECDVLPASSLHEVIGMMTKPSEATPMIACIDLGIPGITNHAFFSFIRSLCHEIPVIIIANDTQMNAASDALRAGACDLLTDPLNATLYNKCLNNALAQLETRNKGTSKLPDDAVSLTDNGGQLKNLHDIEEEAIRYALKMGRSKSYIADRLGIGRTTLYRKVQQIEDAHARQTIAAATC